ncbi:hypothetical protein [Streptomyces sp. NBC_01268]|uniref:hypothetical protein n=1 Tax=unclassified Streptomyces TaxID=2593676 RepID=UPI002E300D1D|nr:hypothetical protein [Streptomyces sp. NBC_01268]
MSDEPAPDGRTPDDGTAHDTASADGTTAESTGGCLLTAAGALAALVYWAPRASFSIDGGFEGHARDLSVVFVDLPLILLGATVLPLVAWLLTLRRRRRPRGPWTAALTALLALALFLYGVDACWEPRQLPDPGYRGGL